MTDYSKLGKVLTAAIEGEVRFDEGSRALYATDASNYRQVPIGVVLPRSAEDVVQTIRLCRDFNAPILSRGAGTSIAGQCCNVAVILDFSKYMNRILEIDLTHQTARVEPGVVLDDLKNAAGRSGLTFGPDPATHSRCTLGGMIGNNSCGIHSVIAGKTVENVEALDILTYDGNRMKVGATGEQRLADEIRAGGRTGQIYAKLHALQRKYADLIRQKYPDIPRRVSGYNLDQLLPENGFHLARALVGSEGTCVTILEATVRLMSDFQHRRLVIMGFSDLETAALQTSQIMEFKPIGLEGVDEYFIRNIHKKGLHREAAARFSEGRTWLFVEFGGETGVEVDDRARSMIDRFKKDVSKPEMHLFRSPEEQYGIWEIRESAFGVTNFVQGEKNTFAGWEDSAVPPEKLGGYLKDLRSLARKYDLDSVFYGHFAEGCIHARISFDLLSRKGIQAYREFINEAADLVLRYGGSLSGEHGDGQTRAHLLPKMFGPELVGAFREFKTIWDPDHRMNPGKIVDPYPVDENIRTYLESQPTLGETVFAYPENQGSFTDALFRCVGIGRCRQKSNGTMCPSYMATLEEKHSTRGRARLLFEMMKGDVIRDGWQSEAVKDSLDLCLSCKACKSECPTQVDMAAYKAEFLSHYYKSKPRPLAALALGRIASWANIASYMPWLANAIINLPVLGPAFKTLAGITHKRPLPQFAHESFMQWHRKQPQVTNAGKKVILWPDTVHNYFYPEILKSAYRVLTKLGYQVLIPAKAFCCGRPLFDYGMAATAKEWLGDIVNGISDFLNQDAPVIVLEPSCASVFKDELMRLYPNDGLAFRMSQQTFLLADFLMRENKQQAFAPLHEKIALHGHCHQTALFGMKADMELLNSLGADSMLLREGCCGLAGSFGFEAKHYDVSVKIGNQRLIPAIQKTGSDTKIVSDGFSCREQISHLSKRETFHLAQILEMALNKRSS